MNKKFCLVITLLTISLLNILPALATVTITLNSPPNLAQTTDATL